MSMRDVAALYLRERYPTRRFGSLAVALAIIGALAAASDWGMPSTPAVRRLGLASVAAWLIVLVFRIWDDLQDRRHDAVAHPDRVSVRGGTTMPLVLMLAASTTVSVLIVSALPDAGARLLALLRLTGTLAVWYWARDRLGTSRIVGAHVVLAKYPVITWAVAPELLSWSSPHLVRGLSLLAGVYLALCIHECVDDPELRSASSTRSVRAAETALLVSLLCAVVASLLLPHSVLYLGGGSLP